MHQTIGTSTAPINSPGTRTVDASHDNLERMLNEVIRRQEIIEQKLDKYIKQESSWVPCAVGSVPKPYE